MADGPRLRVLCYNVHGLRDDPRALHSVVRAAEPDVMIAQEAPRRLRWRTRSASLAHDVGMVVVAGGQPALGNLIMSNLRVHPERTWCMRYPLTPGRHLRGAAFARCTIGRVPFVVAVSHLSTDPAERPGQALLLKKELAGVDAPLVFGGDLNADAGTAAWGTVADGMVDVAEVAGQADRGTYPASGPRARPDAIFVTPDIGISHYDVVDTPAARRASDHLPVLADIVLPAGR